MMNVLKEREKSLEVKAIKFLGVLFIPLFAFDPGFRIFIFTTFLNPISVFNWEPWYYPLGFVSVISMLFLSANTRKFSQKWALLVWGGQTAFCVVWILSKTLIFGHDIFFSLWFIVCGLVSLAVVLSLFNGKEIQN